MLNCIQTVGAVFSRNPYKKNAAKDRPQQFKPNGLFDQSNLTSFFCTNAELIFEQAFSANESEYKAATLQDPGL